MKEVSTSILNAEKGKEAEIILKLEKARTDYFHPERNALLPGTSACLFPYAG